MSASFYIGVLVSLLCAIGITASDVTVTSDSAETPWSFLVLADWHGAEEFVSSPGNNTDEFQEKLSMFQYIHDTYGGELVVAPGDSNSGRWYRDSFIEGFDANMTTTEAILAAGKNCYETMKELFISAGYEKLLMCVGDHELGYKLMNQQWLSIWTPLLLCFDNPFDVGGNGWGKNHSKTLHVSQFREAFSKGFNRDSSTGEFLYTRSIGSATSTPVGTAFEYTSYAYQHKNVLFLTVDAFMTMETEEDEDEYFDRENGWGGEGIITCTVKDEHLSWFRHVLSEAKKDPTIQHIFVQTHVPVLQPVRKITSSGQYMDDESDSEFWAAMVEFGVDVYLAGDVHADTVTKDPSSNLLQVISRGNKANNFLTVKVSNSTIEIHAYNERGELPIGHNHNHTQHGKLVVTKSESVTIESSGSLKMLDRNAPMIHIDFESKVPLETRPIIGMNHDYHLDTLVAKEVTMLGTVCSLSLPNKGVLGQQYDAQVAKLDLVEGFLGNYAGRFHSDSRVGIYSRGPFSGGEVVSLSIWIKTSQSSKEMVIVHYGRSYSTKGNKDIFTMTLNNGNPNVYTKSKPNNYSAKLVPTMDLDLADGEWHHVAVSMPEKSCKLSEVKMTVDGAIVPVTVPKNDHYLFFFTNGNINLGGFGYSHHKYNTLFPGVIPFDGFMDDFFLWSRPLQSDEILSLFNIPSSHPSTSYPTKSNSPTISPTVSLSPTTYRPSSKPTLMWERDDAVCEENPSTFFVKRLIYYQGHKGNVKEARTSQCKWLAWIARPANNPTLASNICANELRHEGIGSAAEACPITCKTCTSSFKGY